MTALADFPIDQKWTAQNPDVIHTLFLSNA